MKTHDAENRATGGFTLGELIAVVAVLCGLVLLAIPAFAKSEGRGLSVACRNNQRLLMTAFHMYADENNSYFAGNQDAGSRWIEIWEPTPATNELHPQLFRFAPYVPPRQNILKCPADFSTTRLSGRDVPRIRSISMSHAVGTTGSSGAEKAPVDGMWLDGGGHRANTQFYCYGKISDLIEPRPSGLYVFIEEHPDSINDGAFANVGPIPPTQQKMIDFPGAWHDGATMMSFADGHVAERKWIDARTVPPPRNSPLVLNVPQPNNPDITWLGNHTTARIAR